MKIPSFLLSLGLLLLFLSCGTLSVGNKPVTEVPAMEEKGEADSAGSGLQGPSEPYVESPDKLPEDSPDNSPEDKPEDKPEVVPDKLPEDEQESKILKKNPEEEVELIGIEDLPDSFSFEEKTIPGPENIHLPDLPEIQRNPYRDIPRANDLDPDEPDHYYLRRKPIEEGQKENVRTEEISPGEKELSSGKNQPDTGAEVVVKESSGPEMKSVTNTKMMDTASTQEVPEARKNSDTPDFEIDAVVGEKIQISLTDHSWVYDRKSSSPDGVEFEGTQYLQESKEFLFQALRVGEYILSFSKPDFNTGKVEKRTVAVTIGGVQENGSEPSVDDFFAGGRKISDSSGYEKGHFSAESLRSGISERNRAVIERQLYLLVDFFSTGESNSEDPKVEGQNVTAGTRFEEVVWSEVLDGVRQLEDTPREPAAERALQLFLSHAAGRFKRLGEVYYLLGRIYETPVPPRDEKKAVEYYGQVLEIYPADIYHFKAEERIKYLKRHFLQIR